MQDGTKRRAASEDETLPETVPGRHETRRVGRGLVVTQLLADVRESVQAHPAGKARRALMQKLESLQFVVDWWDARPPRPEQVSAMLEVLLELQGASDDQRSVEAE